MQQTIALFRFQLPALINTRLLVIVLILLLTAFLINRFVAELAILNSEIIALAAMAEFLRISMVMLLTVSLCVLVSDDYERNQFDRILAMPVSRLQYLLSLNTLAILLVFCLSVGVCVIMMLMGPANTGVYWSLALFLELFLVAQFTLLTSISLERLNAAILLALSLYLIARSAPVIGLMFDQSTIAYGEEQVFQFSEAMFNVIRYVLPDYASFAQNDLIYEPDLPLLMPLLQQLWWVIVYAIFLQILILVDFYRKELN